MLKHRIHLFLHLYGSSRRFWFLLQLNLFNPLSHSPVYRDQPHCVTGFHWLLHHQYSLWSITTDPTCLDHYLFIWDQYSFLLWSEYRNQELRNHVYIRFIISVFILPFLNFSHLFSSFLSIQTPRNSTPLLTWTSVFVLLASKLIHTPSVLSRLNLGPDAFLYRVI